MRKVLLALIVALLGTVVVMAGILGLAVPAHLIRLVDTLSRQPTGLYLIVGLRVAMGIALLSAASESRFPDLFRILGIVSLIAAAGSGLLGLARLSRLIAWWSRRTPAFIRGWSLVAALFGVFLIYGVV